MKKILLVFSLIFTFSLSVFAQEENSNNKTVKNESKWSSFSYVNVPILKILEGKEGYVIVYQKNRVGIGSVVVPKKWAKGSVDSPRKLKFRNVKGHNASFMSIVKKEGEFYRLILSIPMSKNNPVWGINQGTIEGVDKDTLEEIEL